jgi:hypothetical protein
MVVKFEQTFRVHHDEAVRNEHLGFGGSEIGMVHVDAEVWLDSALDSVQIDS